MSPPGYFNVISGMYNKIFWISWFLIFRSQSLELTTCQQSSTYLIHFQLSDVI